MVKNKSDWRSSFNIGLFLSLLSGLSIDRLQIFAAACDEEIQRAIPDQETLLKILRSINVGNVARVVNALTATIETYVANGNQLIEFLLALPVDRRFHFLRGFENAVVSERLAQDAVLRGVVSKLLSVDDYAQFSARYSDLPAQKPPKESISHLYQAAAEIAFSACLKRSGFNANDPAAWIKNTALCRPWIPVLLKDCFFASHLNDVEANQIKNNTKLKLKALAESGQYPEAELAMAILSAAAGEKKQANGWLQKFQSWDTGWVWDKNNRWSMKNLSVACKAFQADKLNFRFKPVGLADSARGDIVTSFVESVRFILTRTRNQAQILGFFAQFPEYPAYRDAVVWDGVAMPSGGALRDETTAFPGHHVGQSPSFFDLQKDVNLDLDFGALSTGSVMNNPHHLFSPRSGVGNDLGPDVPAHPIDLGGIVPSHLIVMGSAIVQEREEQKDTTLKACML